MGMGVEFRGNCIKVCMWVYGDSVVCKDIGGIYKDVGRMV